MRTLFVILCTTLQTLGQIDQDLAASYPLDGNGNDASGNQHHGTFYNSPGKPAWVTTPDRDGRPCAAIFEDGYFGMDFDYLTGPKGSGSLSFWARRDSSLSRTGSLFRGAMDVTVTHDSIQFLNQDGEVWYTLVQSPYKWAHFVWTYSDSVNTVYVNNQAVAWHRHSMQDVGKFNVGGSADYSLDDMRFYSRALAASDVTALYRLAGSCMVTGLGTHELEDTQRVIKAYSFLGHEVERTTYQGPMILLYADGSRKKSVQMQ